MVKTNKLGLIKRLFLVGTLAVGGILGGCGDYYSLSQEERFKEDKRLRNSIGMSLIARGLLDSPNNTPQQNQAVRSLGVGVQNYQRDQAIGNSGGNVNVNINHHYSDQRKTGVLKDYGDGWIKISIFPNTMVNIRTQEFAPEPGYVWKNPYDPDNYFIIRSFKDPNDIEKYKIAPKKNKNVKVRRR